MLKHIYLHVPFCDGKCVYCGFYSGLYENSQADCYIEAVAKELDLHFAGIKPMPGTIYFGGGTPSILSEKQLARLCDIVLERISADALKEWTIEANPGTLTASKLRILKEAGVNRISIGAQSFDDKVLKSLGRRHGSAEIVSTVKSIMSAGIERVGLDLIAGLPGVDLTMWRKTIQQAIELEPGHVSVYALSVEEDSRFEKLVRAGNVVMPSDDHILEALDIAEAMLDRVGLERYEISNFARKGMECLHNLSFWRGDDYAGFGPAAASREGLLRRTNRADADQYISALLNGRKLLCEEEELSAVADVMERLVFAFRLKEGVNMRMFGAKFGISADVVKLEKVLNRLSGEGLTVYRNGTWCLTPSGRNMADHVAVELMTG